MTRGTSTLARYLDGLLGRSRRRLWGHGLATLGTVGGAALLAAAWTAGGSVWPATWSLWGLALSLGAFLTLLAIRFLVLPLDELRRHSDLVERLERTGNHANVLVAAEESLRRSTLWQERGTAAVVLLERLRRRALEILSGLDADTVVPLPDRRPLVLAMALVLAATGVLGTLSGGELRRGAGRLATPWQGPPAPPTGGIYGLATGPFAVAGDTVTLQAIDLADGDDAAVCEVRLGTGLWQRISTSLVRPSTRSAGRTWQARVLGVRDDLDWRFRRRAMVSPVRHLEVRERPLLAAVSARVEPPAYTRIAAQDVAELPGWLEVPTGSRVSLRGRTSHAVVRAFMVDSTGDTLVLAADSTHVTGSFTADRSRVFRLHVVDAWKLTNASPLRYRISAAADESPVAELTRPHDDGLLPLGGTLDLQAAADDDYGVADLALELRIRGKRETGSAPWQRVPLLDEMAGTWIRADLDVAGFRWRMLAVAGDDPPLQRRLALELQLGDLHLVAGDVLEMALVARDNRRPGPPGTGRSRVLRFLAPSASDLLAQQEESGEARQDELAEMQRRGRELGEDLERLTRELMKNPVPDWGRQQEMEDALRRRSRLQEELSRVADELAQELENLAQSELTSERQLRRSEEVGGLLQQENSDRLSDLVNRFEQDSDRPDAAEVSRALREASRDQQEMARRLDAALDMLARMERQQDMEGMTALLEQVLRKQQELADLSRELAEQDSATEGEREGDAADEEPRDMAAADGESPGEETQPPGDEPAQGSEADPQELARRQEALAQELEKLSERLEKALEEMRERAEAGDQEPGEEAQREALEEALEQLEQQLAQGDMQEAAAQLEQMDPQQAAQMQEQAMRDLGALYHVMLESQEAMQMALQMNQARSLRGLAADLLEVSGRQEVVADKVPLELREVRTLGLTRDQHRLQKAAVQVRDELAGVTTDSPMRIQKQLKKLDGLIEEMGQAVRSFEENRAPAARSYSRRSLANVNRIVIGLLTEAQMVSGSSGQGSSTPQSAAEQLQEMVRQQAELNGATDELRRMLADRGMSQELRAGMERLGEQQARMAEHMREVAEDERIQPEGERLLGDLGALARDMETVAGDLDSGLANDEVLARQERILGRMLDARNSVRRRDYSRRRESRRATALYGRQTGPVGPDAGRESRRDALRYESLERAPLAYRELVRRYYAALDSLQPGPVGGEEDLP